MLKNHILCGIGGCKLPKLSAEIIDKFTENMLNYGRKDKKGGLSPKTVRDMLSAIKSILDYARERHKAIKEFKITYPKHRQRPMRVLSKQEQAALERKLTNNPDIFKTGILLSLYTGLRLGEVCALRWGDISLENGTVTVNKTLQRVQDNDADGTDDCNNTADKTKGGVSKKTADKTTNKTTDRTTDRTTDKTANKTTDRTTNKTTNKKTDKTTNKTKIIIDKPKTQNSLREIPLPKTLIALLSHQASNGSDDRFLLSGDSFARTEPRTLQNHFKKHLMSAGVAPANFHSTRHTFATRCIEVGMDVKSLSEILGHSNVNITLNRYVHSSFDQKREGMSRLNRLFSLKIS